MPSERWARQLWVALWLAQVASLGLMGTMDALARQDSTASVESAVRWLDALVPWTEPNADYLERIAVREDSPAAWVRVTQANPRLTRAWLRQALALERSGQTGEAEQALLEAARIDRQWLPAWTLTNFYFRQAQDKPPQQAEFWRWAYVAASRTYDDFRPLLELADALEPDAGQVLARLDPQAASPRLARTYLDALIGQQRWEAAEQLAVHLASQRDPSDERRFRNLAERLLVQHRSAAALRVWNLTSAPLDPLRGPVVSNPDFLLQPSGEGFDWRVGTCPGLATRWSPGDLRFEVATETAEGCVWLEQIVPVAPGRTYQLLADGDSAQPLHWTLDGQELAGYRAAGEGTAALRLTYLRAPGTRPFIGSMHLRKIRLEVR